uniref:Uncharacterized protein n=1 Tax=Naja naja TaxID=35670 RepID=A0A8C6VNW1_NAJNA
CESFPRKRERERKAGTMLRRALLFLFSGLCAWGFNLDSKAPTVFVGPPGSFFGFSVDFYLPEEQSILVGAPKAETGQSEIRQGGAVFYCPWHLGNNRCTTIEFDRSRLEEINGTLKQMEFKSLQWFGATVRSHGKSILACAPLYSWRTTKDEPQREVVGTCYLSINNFTKFVEYAPCRSGNMRSMREGIDNENILNNFILQNNE